MSIRKMLSQFRLVRQPSSRLTKVAVCAAIVLAVVALLVLHSRMLDARAESEAWRAEAQKQEQEKNQLKEQLDNLGTLEGIKDIAEGQLGLTDPDTVVIQPEN